MSAQFSAPNRFWEQCCRQETRPGQSAPGGSAAATPELLKSTPPCHAYLPACLPACRWFDLVVVLQTDNTVLWERLEKR